MSTAKLSMNPEAFSMWVFRLHESFPDIEVIVMSTDEETLIAHHFFKGDLNDVVKYDTDSRGKIHMYLAGIRTMFTDRCTVNRPLFVVKGFKPANGKPNGPNPVFPTTGPGGPHNGGTPVGAGPVELMAI